MFPQSLKESEGVFWICWQLPRNDEIRWGERDHQQSSRRSMEDLRLVKSHADWSSWEHGKFRPSWEKEAACQKRIWITTHCKRCYRCLTVFRMVWYDGCSPYPACKHKLFPGMTPMSRGNRWTNGLFDVVSYCIWRFEEEQSQLLQLHVAAQRQWEDVVGGSPPALGGSGMARRTSECRDVEKCFSLHMRSALKCL